MNINLVLKKISSSVLFFLGARLFSLFKMSFVWGSHMALFSAANIVTPLAGAFGGLTASFGVLGLSLLVKFLLFKSVPLTFLAYYIPGFFASVYFARRSSLVRIGVPLACISLFVAHPVGAQAFLYAALWLIPVMVYPYTEKHVFFTALGSTFTAHAVGSVIWLYAMPATPVFWLALIPVALAERFCFALGITALHTAISYGISLSRTYIQRAFNAVTC